MAYGEITLLEMARRRRHWSQRELCARAEVDRSTISRSEAGALPSWAARSKIAAALEMSVEELWPTRDNATADTVAKSGRGDAARRSPTR